MGQEGCHCALCCLPCPCPCGPKGLRRRHPGPAVSWALPCKSSGGAGYLPGISTTSATLLLVSTTRRGQGWGRAAATTYAPVLAPCPRGGVGAVEGLAPSRVPPLRPRRCSWYWRRRGGKGGAGRLPPYPVLAPGPKGGAGAVEGLAPSRTSPLRPRRCSWCWRCRGGTGGAGGLSLRPPLAPCP